MKQDEGKPSTQATRLAANASNELRDAFRAEKAAYWWAGSGVVLLVAALLYFMGHAFVSVTDEFGNEIGSTAGHMSLGDWVACGVLAVAGFVLFSVGSTKQDKARKRREQAQVALAAKIDALIDKATPKASDESQQPLWPPSTPSTPGNP